MAEESEAEAPLACEPCRVCTGRAARLAFALPRFDLYECHHCTHLFSDLNVEPEAYGPDYFLEKHQDHWDNPDRKLFDRLDAVILEATGRERSDLRTLDVGTGTGMLAKHFGDLGYESCGIDISEEAIHYGTESLGISGLKATPVEKFQPPVPFPVITNVHTIEHIEDPVDFLSHIRGILADDGVFICVTVDSSSLIFSIAKWLHRFTGGRSYSALERLCEVHHLHHFTQQSLDCALRRAGLGVIQRWQANLPLASIELTPLQRVTVASLHALTALFRSRFVQCVACQKVPRSEQ